MENIVVGIEGLVGSGKTSICKCLLEYIDNSILFHMGNLYRAIVYGLLSEYHSIDNMKQKLQHVNIKEKMDNLNIAYKIENRETQIYINDKKITEEILQSPEISMGVSVISNVVDNKDAFIVVKKIVDEMKEKYNVIASGRALVDIYPEMDYHFFIIASLDERVNRKYIQYKGKVSKKDLKNHISTRDQLQDKSGFYKKYNKTIIVDVTECKSARESTELVLDKMQDKKILLQACK